MPKVYEDFKKPKVTVCMITYNHERYISAAIESVLSQITDFDFRLVIGDDHSIDETTQLCRNFAAQHPHRIELITSEKNVGMMKNFIHTLNACNGEYTAFIEGDDYWTDPFKLQKQVNFLNSDRSYIACFHNVTVKMERMGKNEEWIFHDTLEKETFQTPDLLGPWFIPSASFIFRNQEDFKLPDWFNHCKSGDIPLMLLLSLKGKFKYLDEIMGVYRLHDNGVSNQHRGWDKIVSMIYIYESFNIHTGYVYKEKVREAVIYEIKTHLPEYSKGETGSPSGPGQNLLKKMTTKIRHSLKISK